MNGIPVIKRYARALYEVGRDAGALQELRADMDFISRILKESPEIRRFCLQAHNNRRKEELFVRNAFVPYVSSYTGRMLEALCANDRLSAVPFIPEAFHEREDLEQGRISLDIESAGEISDGTLKEIEDRMHRRTGKEIKSSVRINPGLIGGVRINWENRTLDLSLRGRLNEMRRRLA